MQVLCTFTKVYQHVSDRLKIVSAALRNSQVIVDGCISSIDEGRGDVIQSKEVGNGMV